MIKAFDYEGDLLSTDRWINKEIITFGDSRLAYDGSNYWNYAKPEWRNREYYSIQDVLRKILGCNITNNSVAGSTSLNICERIKNTNFSNYDSVLLCGGINDWRENSSIPLGTLESIGTSFDVTTVYGSWQSAVEYILNNYPHIKIYLSTPYIGWFANNVEMPQTYYRVKTNIANLYSLNCIDLYKCNINILNRNYFYADVTNYIHANDYGNKLIGNIIAGYMIAN